MQMCCPGWTATDSSRSALNLSSVATLDPKRRARFASDSAAWAVNTGPMTTLVPFALYCMALMPCAAAEAPEFACEAWFSNGSECKKPHRCCSHRTSHTRIQFVSPKSCFDTSSSDIKGGAPGSTDPPMHTAQRWTCSRAQARGSTRSVCTSCAEKQTVCWVPSLPWCGENRSTARAPPLQPVSVQKRRELQQHVQAASLAWRPRRDRGATSDQD
jgi:hypothetical protein